MARPTQRARALSQNFLADRATAERFARLAVPHHLPTPLVLEVGAGKGALTDALAQGRERARWFPRNQRALAQLRESDATAGIRR